MSKVMLGLVLGAVLGAIDGACAYLYPDPEVRSAIVGIVIASTIKGLLTGAAAGWVASRFQSMPGAIGTGLVVGCLLSWVAALGSGYYAAIMIPGTLLGGVTGFASQRFGRTRTAAA